MGSHYSTAVSINIFLINYGLGISLGFLLLHVLCASKFMRTSQIFTRVGCIKKC